MIKGIVKHQVGNRGGLAPLTEEPSEISSLRSQQGLGTLAGNGKAGSPERRYIKLGEPVRDPNDARHLARYQFADLFIPAGSTILDCACGSGYGSAILSGTAKKVLAVDRSKRACAYAKAENWRENVEVIQSEISNLDLSPGLIDAVVSLETLEHLSEESGRQLLLSISRWLHPGGVVVASSPMLRYLGGKPYVTNPHHINEMPRAKLMSMVMECLENFILSFFHQVGSKFVPLCDEHTGFCIIVARKIS